MYEDTSPYLKSVFSYGKHNFNHVLHSFLYSRFVKDASEPFKDSCRMGNEENLSKYAR